MGKMGFTRTSKANKIHLSRSYTTGIICPFEGSVVLDHCFYFITFKLNILQRDHLTGLVHITCQHQNFARERHNDGKKFFHSGSNSELDCQNKGQTVSIMTGMGMTIRSLWAKDPVVGFSCLLGTVGKL